MSMERHPQAKFGNWRGPLFPGAALLQLSNALRDRWRRGRPFRLEESAYTLAGFVSCGPVVTSDGYSWFAGARFKVSSGAIVMITVPYCTHTSARCGWAEDGYPFDRSPAVYVYGEVDEARVESTVRSYAAALAQYTER